MAERVVKVRLSAQISEYASAMEEAANKTRAVGSESERLAQKEQAFRSLGTALTVVGGAMTAVGLAVAKTGIEYNTLQQTSRAALATLLGGAQAANAQMDKLDEFARTSPFAKQTFITAQQQMLAFGIESKKVVPYLDAIQDAVAAAGGSSQQLGEVAFVMAQISAAGKITGQDLIQFGQRGINAAELIGSSMGKTGAQIRADITAGTLGADEALDALASGMKTKFDGAAANVKNTFSGAMDRVQAAWRDLSADLMKPLVDPNGGGALVGLLNWSADVLRAFQGLPEPIKLVSGALFAIVGVVALLSGALLLGVPKIAAFKLALQDLSITGATARTGLGRFASFLGGPWGVALAAATVAMIAYSKANEAGRTSVEDLKNSLISGSSSADLFKKATQGNQVDQFFWGSYEETLKNLPDLLDKARNSTAEWWDLSFNEQNSLNVIGDIGDALADLARDDMPKASAAFKQLIDDYQLTDAQAQELLKNMPALRDALLEQANAEGVASDDAALLNRLLSQTAPAVDDVSQAAQEAQASLSDMAQALSDVAGAAMDVAEAHDDALSSINALKDAADEEGVSLDGVNDSSIRFRESLRAVEEAHRDSAAAILENGGTLEDAKAEWLSGRDAVIEMLVAKGLDIERAKAWADQNLGSSAEVTNALIDVKDAVNSIPDGKNITIGLSGAAVAISEIQRVNDQLNSLPAYKGITVGVNGGVSGLAQPPGHAAGGPIHGRGPKGVDSELRMLAPGEHVITAAEVDAAGGHGAVEAWRASLMSGGKSGVWHPGESRTASVVQVAVPSLDGMQISGTLDLGNGLTGFVQGIVSEQSRQVQSGIRNRRRADA